jgi:hypothetical protein
MLGFVFAIAFSGQSSGLGSAPGSFQDRAGSSVRSAPSPAPRCDQSLWAHVYAGEPLFFDKPQDRLKIIEPCVRVSGVIETASKEPDGDVRIRLRLDPQFQSMLNAKNRSGQRGDLVLELVCVSEPTQLDTIGEHVCDNFSQSFDRSLVGTHVQVVGAYVTNIEHGWHEIHPVTSIEADGAPVTLRAATAASPRRRSSKRRTRQPRHAQ